MLLCYFSAALLKSCIFHQTIAQLRLTSPPSATLSSWTGSTVNATNGGKSRSPELHIPPPPSHGRVPRRSGEMFLCLAYQFCMILQVTKKHSHPSETFLCGCNALMSEMLGAVTPSLFLILRHVRFFFLEKPRPLFRFTTTFQPMLG